MIRSSFGTGRYVAVENDVVYGTTHTWNLDQPNGVVFCHAAGGNATTFVADANLLRLAEGLARHATVHVGDLGGDPFGNDTGEARIEQAVAYLRSAWGQTGPVVLVAVSMGFITAANYALRLPTEVAAIAACVPGIDIADLYTRGAGLPELIDAAYPPAYNDATNGPLHSPSHFVTSLDTDLPIRLWTSSNDPFAVPATADAFVAARPQTERINLGAVGHTGLASSVDGMISYVEQFTYPR